MTVGAALVAVAVAALATGVRDPRVLDWRHERLFTRASEWLRRSAFS